MIRNRKTDPASGMIIFIFALLSAVAIREGYIGSADWHLILIPTLPLLLLAINTKLKYFEKRR